MSVKVNLLPQEQTARQAVARQRNAVVTGGVVLVALLGAVTIWQNGNVTDAEDRLATEQGVLLSLQSEVNALAEFADLDRAATESRTRIVAALGDEVSFAGILQDVAAVLPSDAQLEAVDINVDPAAAIQGAGPPSLGTVAVVGKSLNDHAGLERVLLEFDKVNAFRDVFFSSSILEEPTDPYPTFTVEGQLGPETLTGRYLDGVPEGLR